MKTLIAGLLFIGGLPLLIPLAAFYFAKPDAPVEQKVVEIHMSVDGPTTIPEAKHKTRTTVTLPLKRAGTCSGEFVTRTGDILTARHCVDGFDTFEVQTFDSRRYTAIVIATSTAHDLAMVHIDRLNTPFFALASTVVRGQTIFVLGSPLGITDTLSTGIVARIGGDVTLLDCSALPGNSGGPVFDKERRLVGVLNAGFIVMAGVTHLNQAQGLDAIRFFIREALEKRYGR